MTRDSFSNLYKRGMQLADIETIAACKRNIKEICTIDRIRQFPQ